MEIKRIEKIEPIRKELPRKDFLDKSKNQVVKLEQPLDVDSMNPEDTVHLSKEARDLFEEEKRGGGI